MGETVTWIRLVLTVCKVDQDQKWLDVQRGLPHRIDLFFVLEIGPVISIFHPLQRPHRLIPLVNGLQETSRAFRIADGPVGDAQPGQDVFQGIVRLGAHGRDHHGRRETLLLTVPNESHRPFSDLRHGGADEDSAASLLDALVKEVAVRSQFLHGVKRLHLEDRGLEAPRDEEIGRLHADVSGAQDHDRAFDGGFSGQNLPGVKNAGSFDSGNVRRGR